MNHKMSSILSLPDSITVKCLVYAFALFKSLHLITRYQRSRPRQNGPGDQPDGEGEGTGESYPDQSAL
jgi:hypothetical protein